MTNLNFIDLFCGAGGLSSGLIKSGMNCLLGVDFLEPAIDTFKVNHKSSIGICDDIRDLRTKDIKELLNNKKYSSNMWRTTLSGFFNHWSWRC